MQHLAHIDTLLYKEIKKKIKRREEKNFVCEGKFSEFLFKKKIIKEKKRKKGNFDRVLTRNHCERKYFNMGVQARRLSVEIF